MAVFAFGQFELDVGARELRRDGQSVPMQPRVFSTLRYLIEHRDRVVSQQELIDALWQGAQLNPVAVPWSISHARRALGQRGNTNLLIETVRGRGYRFIADVRSHPDAVTSEDPALSWHGSGRPAAAGLFVGRDEVMARLVAALGEARAGLGGLNLLIGEPGIGKTRCSQEVAELARRGGLSVWTGRCLDSGAAPAFWPWIALLRECVEDPTLGADQRSELRALLQQLVPRTTAAEDAPEDPPSGPTATERFWLLDRLIACLREAAASTVRVLVLDDLHWADDGSLEVLALLARELPRTKLLVIGTMRDAPAGPAQRSESELLARLRPCECFKLSGLLLADVERYLENAIGEPPSLQLSRAVHAKTAGNPLFLREAVRLLSDHRARGRELLPEELPLPEAAKGFLGNLIATLEPATREVLEAACVIGEEFELSVLQQVTELSAEQLLARLDGALRAQIIAPRPDLQRQGFTHALMRDALYQTLSAGECVRLHGRVGLALEARALVEPRLHELAYHFHFALPGDHYERVVRYGRLAGDAAMRVFAYGEAAKLYGWALAAQPYVAPADARAAGTLLLASAAALQGAGKHDESRARCEQVIELARERGIAELLVKAARVMRPSVSFSQRPDPLATAALEEALARLPESAKHTRAQAYSRLAYFPPYTSSIEESQRVSELAVELAREVGDPRLLVETLCSRFRALSGPDSIDALLAVVDEVLRLEPHSASFLGAQAELARSDALLLRGDVAGADRALEAYARIGRELRLDTASWHYERRLAQRLLHGGELDRAELLFDQLWRRGQQLNLPYAHVFHLLHTSALSFERSGRLLRSSAAGAEATRWGSLPSLRVNATLAVIESGQIERGRSELELYRRDSYAAVTRDASCLYTLARLAQGAIALDHRAAAAELYALLLPYASFNAVGSTGFTLGSVAFPLGRLARHLHERGAARAHFEDAIARNTRFGYRPHALRSRLGLASLLAESNRAAERKRARALASEVSTAASALGMAALAEQARAVVESRHGDGDAEL